MPDSNYQLPTRRRATTGNTRAEALNRAAIETKPDAPLMRTQRRAQNGRLVVSSFPNLRSMVSEDGAVILDIDHDSISTLNPTGAYVWERLQRGESLEGIIAALAYDTGESTCRVDRDVREFAESLKQRQLLPR